MPRGQALQNATLAVTGQPDPQKAALRQINGAHAEHAAINFRAINGSFTPSYTTSFQTALTDTMLRMLQESKTLSSATSYIFRTLSRRVFPTWKFIEDRRASAVLELAFVAPVFLLLLFSILGAGMCNFYQLGLDEAVRYAARQVQISGPASTSGANFAAAVCTEFGVMAPNCASNLTYNVQTNASSTANFASLVPIAMPASGSLPNSFPSALPANNNVLVQVAFPLPFALPFVGTALTLTGTNSILSIATVRMEPYQ